MMDSKIKQAGLYLVASLGSTFFSIFLLWFATYGIFKMFSIESKLLWLISIIFISISVAWIQGTIAGVSLNYNFLLGAFISTLTLNIFTIISFLKIPIYVPALSIVFPLIFINYVVAFLGCRYSFKFRVSSKNEDKHGFVFLVTTNIFLLIPIFIIGWLAIILLLKYGFSLSI